MTIRELIDYCLTYPATYEDYPFDPDIVTIRHGYNKKIFALISQKDGRMYINLKCDPNQADFFRSVYKDVTPGWHMNKQHWNTVYLNGDVPDSEVFMFISHSYDLVKPKIRAEKIPE